MSKSILSPKDIADYNALTFAERAESYAKGLAQKIKDIELSVEQLRSVEAGEPQVDVLADWMHPDAPPADPVTVEVAQGWVLKAVRAAERYAASHRDFVDAA